MPPWGSGHAWAGETQPRSSLSCRPRPGLDWPPEPVSDPESTHGPLRTQGCEVGRRRLHSLTARGDRRDKAEGASGSKDAPRGPSADCSCPRHLQEGEGRDWALRGDTGIADLGAVGGEGSVSGGPGSRELPLLPGGDVDGRNTASPGALRGGGASSGLLAPLSPPGHHHVDLARTRSVSRTPCPLTSCPLGGCGPAVSAAPTAANGPGRGRCCRTTAGVSPARRPFPPGSPGLRWIVFSRSREVTPLLSLPVSAGSGPVSHRRPWARKGARLRLGCRAHVGAGAWRRGVGVRPRRATPPGPRRVRVAGVTLPGWQVRAGGEEPGGSCRRPGKGVLRGPGGLGLAGTWWQWGPYRALRPGVGTA